MTDTDRTTDDGSAVGNLDPRPSTHLPGDADMWIFVLGDLIIFGIYFLIFLVDRDQHRDLFLESQQHLSLNVGFVNTLVLITSSWLVARAVIAARAGDLDRSRQLVVSGGACGVLFILIKAYEWTVEVGRGMTFPHNDFFMYYYMLTGIHVFHVGLGLVFLAVVYVQLRKPHRQISLVEAGAVYWHMVDLLWLIIFALVYVMR
ncbi:cytochrome c oxidase subunit 3 [Nocardia sp. NPDC049526]|uniref:cytochrome c oxidase subunit 3 n=1 Tax=Nocardia sp. NPDC049526 TaxID=3364316 RepID=UPI0037B51082